MIKRPLKIAFVSLPDSIFNDGAVRSGSVIVNDQLIFFLRKQGHHVLELKPAESRVELRKLSGFGNALMFQDLLRHIDEINKCDLIVSTNYFGASIPEIKIPQVTIFHHCAKTLLSFIDGEAEIVDKNILQKWQRKFLRYGLFYKNEESFHDRIVSLLEQYACENSASVIAVSRSIKDEIISNYSISAEKVQVAYNSVPESWLNRQVQKDFSVNKMNLICVTRMPGSEPGLMMKGIDRIFEIMTSVRGYNKILVASTHNQNYRQMVKEQFRDVEVKWNLSHEEVSEAFLSSHISIHCSRVESFGLTLVESMLMGNIVLVYPVGVAPEIIKHGENGFIVRSVTDIKKLLKQIPKMNNLAEISTNARATVINKMSPDNFIQSYLDVFEKIVKE
ncbi:MAG: Glycosyltransferase Gtf1 [bacterium ADurb.Bin212]|nr:MAG: Glycosyltransferase Gtf1 [bacterium ADurb.Bin212]